MTDRARGSRQMSLRPALSRLLTVQEVADLLQVPPKTIYAWRYRGLGPTAVPVGKYLRFRPEDVAAWLEARAEPERRRVGQPVGRGAGQRLRTARPHDDVSTTPANSRHMHPGKSPRS
jgi:excisionase family DNA binding protein